MTDQEMDRMNDYLLEQSLIMHERQEERDFYGNPPFHNHQERTNDLH